MKKKYSDLPAWCFDLDEVSASVYRVVGTDNEGRVVTVTGEDLENVVEQCKTRAEEIESTLKRD